MTDLPNGATPLPEHASHADAAVADAAPIAVPSDEGETAAAPAGDHPIAAPVAPAPGDAAAGSDVTPAAPRPALGIASLRGDVQDRLVAAAEEGKARAGDALQSVAQMLFDAADQVDQRVGSTYGDHVRTAGTAVEDFAAGVRTRDLDAFAADARAFVARSPAAAVGIAATLGFALARVVHAGIDPGVDRRA